MNKSHIKPQKTSIAISGTGKKGYDCCNDHRGKITFFQFELTVMPVVAVDYRHYAKRCLWVLMNAGYNKGVCVI